MIRPDDRHLLFIEPTGLVSDEAVEDIYTAKMRTIYDHAECLGDDPRNRYRGTHVCSCGKHSANYNWQLTSGMLINSLALHYLQWHRNDVPRQELEKVKMAFYD